MEDIVYNLDLIMNLLRTLVVLAGVFVVSSMVIAVLFLRRG